jgi:uncharacterized membrane protein
MFNLVKAGRAMFAAGIMALGMLCIVYKDFVVGRPPAWPASFHVNPALGYISGTMLIVCAIAIFVNRYVAQAALCIGALILLFSVFRHLFTLTDTWINAFKSIALLGSCLIIAAGKNHSTSVLPALQNNKLFLTGVCMLASFLLIGGYAHFKYAAFVDTLIPAYIPFHPFWTYFCGICLFAAGAGLLIPAARRLAALLSGIMITGWFFLLHIPRFLADTGNTSDELGVFESFAFAGVCFCVAGLLTKADSKTRALADRNAYLGEMGIK